MKSLGKSQPLLEGVSVRPRLLLVVQPAVYEAGLWHLLARADIDQIVCSHGDDGVVEGSYDVTVVTGDVPDGVDTQTVIRLPATESGTGDLTVTTGGESRTVPVGDVREILEAIDDAMPCVRRRTDTLDLDGPPLASAR
jgi:hypothetical protein